MTVCIAAMFGVPGVAVGVVGASDRMWTAADVEYEPPVAKVVNLTSSIAMLISGDSAFQIDICRNVIGDVYEQIQKAPDRWLLVSEVTTLYARYYREAKLQEAERDILAPLGLTTESFLLNQKDLQPDFAKTLATELINYEAPSVGTIITGTDPNGPQIFTVQDGVVRCWNGVGFAAIGIGRWHAESYLMSSKYCAFKSFPEALIHVYSAKKRAEVSPGVGSETDLFSVGLGCGTYVTLSGKVVDDLERIHSRRVRSEGYAERRAVKEATKYVEEITRAAAPKEQAVQQDGDGCEPSNQEGVRGGAAESQSED